LGSQTRSPLISHMSVDSLGTPHSDIEYSGILVYIDISGAYLVQFVQVVYLYLDIQVSGNEHDIAISGILASKSKWHWVLQLLHRLHL
jgi:hypothetical protein